MSARGLEDVQLATLQRQLKALGNRYAMEILESLSPQAGEIIPTLGLQTAAPNLDNTGHFRI